MFIIPNLKIGTALVISTFVITITIVLVVTLFTSSELMDYIVTSVETDSKLASENFIQEVESYKLRALEMSHKLAENRNIIDCVATKDHQAVLNVIMKLSEVMQTDFITITNTNGIVIARSHDPEKYGDDIKNQLNISKALQGATVAVMEAGTVVKLSVRSGSPIKNSKGETIGIVSTGYRLDNNRIVDKMRATFDCDFTIFLNDTRVSTTIADENGNRRIGTKCTPDVAEVVLNKKIPYTGEADVFGKTYIVNYLPLKGPNDSIIGILFAGKSLESAVDHRNSTILLTVIAAIVLFIFSLFIFHFVIVRINRKQFSKAHAGK